MKIFFIVVLLAAIAVTGVLVWSSADNNGTEIENDLAVGEAIEESGSGLLDSLTDLVPEPSEPTTIKLAPQTVTADNKELTFQVAEPFKIAVAAEGLGKARFMSLSPDGRMFIPDLVNYNLSHAGKIYILENFDPETKRFQTKHTYLSGLRGPNSVAFYTDKDGQDWLYVALTAHLLRYKYEPGDTKPASAPEIVTEFPNQQSPGEVSVVWHITRTLLFHNDQLYIAIGSGCNSCEHLEGGLRGNIVVMNPDGTNKRVYADGLRNTVGLAWAQNSLWATANGVDHLGPDAPDELMYKIIEGKHYGWPYCYEVTGKITEERPGQWDKDFTCATVPHSFTAFEPHSAPLGLRYFEDAHPVLKNSFLVALHGSFEPEIKAGYQIMRVSDRGEKAVFMDGFQTASGERQARAVDFFQHSKNSFFFTDDHSGRVYYVYAE